MDSGPTRATFLALCAAAVAAAGTSGALASSDYSVHVSAPKTVAKGDTFKIAVKGFAKKPVDLAVWLAYGKCAASVRKEGIKENSPPESSFNRPGRSHFDHDYLIVARNFSASGSFKRSPKPHAGTIVHRGHVCAYLTDWDQSAQRYVTKARASTSYEVTK